MSKSVGHCLLLLSSIFLLNSHGGVSLAPLPGCPVSDCGNGVKIKYPFWSRDNATGDEYCGYPQFALSCSNKEPVLSIDDEDFLVKAIDYTNFTITLVDKDVAGNQCPRARHNITLGDYPLGFTDLDVNISFYFNCSSNPFTSYATDGILCLGFNDLQSYAVLVEDNTEDVVWMGKCQANVVVTVMKEANVTGIGLISGFGAAMNRGFELNWTTAEKCGECERSEGLCGYNTTAADYICYCQDGSVSNPCKGTTALLPFALIN